jgi:hypothetical protein
MFSSCDACESCKLHFIGNCLAGHGDNDYEFASPEWLTENAALIERRARERAEFYKRAMEDYNTRYGRKRNDRN